MTDEKNIANVARKIARGALEEVDMLTVLELADSLGLSEPTDEEIDRMLPLIHHADVGIRNRP